MPSIDVTSLADMTLVDNTTTGPAIEGQNRDNESFYESVPITLTGNAYRFFVEVADDVSLTVRCQPAGTTRSFAVQSFSQSASAFKIDEGLGDVPLVFLPGDVITVRATVLGDPVEADASFFLEDITV